MVALPVTMPTFNAGDSTISKLQQLKYGVEYLIDCQVNPNWHFYKTGTFSLTASTWNTPGYQTVAFDSDNTQSSGSAVVATQGIYAVEGCAQVNTGTTSTLFKVGFLVTGGGNNPHLSTGSTLQFGQRGGDSATSQATTCSAGVAADLTPICLYPLDKVDLQVWIGSSSISVQNNNTTNYLFGRFSANFTGRWIRTAT